MSTVEPNSDDQDVFELVYFVLCAGRIKIGYTASLKSRLIKMKTDMPVPPKFLHIEIGSKTTERILHREFADLRLHGEWFKVDQRIYDHIQRRRTVLGMAPFIPPNEASA
jgi:hypothetical protein